MPDTQPIDDRRRAVESHPFWYHTLDLGDGLVTPGYFDLRHIFDSIPFFPDVRGKRCLDIGTYDGFFAFEMERRGAAEVVATDIEDHLLWDWPPDVQPNLDNKIFEGEKGDGFRLAAQLLDSKVDWRAINIYDLNPDELGTFDVVTCGSLLLHLRDPLRALAAVRSVTAGVFLSSEEIDLWLSVTSRHKPVARINGSGPMCQWWNANAAGHRQMLTAGGFAPGEVSKPYVVRFNTHPRPSRSPRALLDGLALRAITRDRHPGILHRAILSRPLP
jgi:tRNA (mo5U34)-methyltransferase